MAGDLFLGKVIGNVWATRKYGVLHTFKLMLVQPINAEEENIGEPIIAVDTVGAGDAYAAILCLGYLNEMPLMEINELTNEFAAEIYTVNGALPDNDAFYKKWERF